MINLITLVQLGLRLKVILVQMQKRVGWFVGLIELVWVRGSSHVWFYGWLDYANPHNLGRLIWRHSLINSFRMRCFFYRMVCFIWRLTAYLCFYFIFSPCSPVFASMFFVFVVCQSINALVVLHPQPWHDSWESRKLMNSALLRGQSKVGISIWRQPRAILFFASTPMSKIGWSRSHRAQEVAEEVQAAESQTLKALLLANRAQAHLKLQHWEPCLQLSGFLSIFQNIIEQRIFQNVGPFCWAENGMRW